MRCACVATWVRELGHGGGLLAWECGWSASVRELGHGGGLLGWEQGWSASAQDLLEAKADINAQKGREGGQGQTSADLAALSGGKEMVALLKDCGVGWGY